MLITKPVVITPKTLFVDIETSPNLAWVWGKYEQDVLGDYVLERQIISVSWKWLGSPKVEAMSIPDFYGYKKYPLKNKKLIEKLHSLFSSADIIVAQNGNDFDFKMANAEFIQYGFDPPSSYKTVDTLKVARSKFRFNSNKLDDLGARLGLGRKIHTGGFKLWEGCLRGEKAAWDRMIRYNKQDIILLEKIYFKLRPWMTNHPNMNAFDGGQGCPSCKSNHIISKGYQLMPKGRKKRYKCQDCGKSILGAYESAGVVLT